MDMDDTVKMLSEKYNMRYTEASLLIDMIKGRLFFRNPVKYISNHNDTMITAGLIADKYLGIRRVREQKYYDKLHNVVI